MIDGPRCDISQRRVPILTRPAGQSAGVREALARLGMPSLDFPLIDIQPIDDYAALDAALDAIESFSLVFFVSPNAIEQVFTRARGRGVDLAALLSASHAQTIIAVVGPGSARTLASYRITPLTHRIVAPEGVMDDLRRQEKQSAPEEPVLEAKQMQAAGQLQASQHLPEAEQPPLSQQAPGQESQRPAASDAVLSDVSIRGPHAALSAADAIRYDSEALWQALCAEVDIARFAGRRALIFRGDGGREWFADALRSAGMGVQAVAAYRRGPPQVNNETWQQIENVLDSQRAVWVLSSSEGVRNLETLALARYCEAPIEQSGHRLSQRAPDPRYAALKRCTVIVPHHRIAAAASRAGFDTIMICGGGDANLLRALCEIQQ
jgi:uroporphyrinogen III methyltransferase/synthase